MEDLGEFDGVLASIDEEVTRDEAENAVVDWGLGIEALDGMLDLAERAELFNDCGNTLELLTLKAEHRVVSVELLELLKSVLK